MVTTAYKDRGLKLTTHDRGQTKNIRRLVLA